jgi:hypothetical protein
MNLTYYKVCQADSLTNMWQDILHSKRYIISLICLDFPWGVSIKDAKGASIQNVKRATNVC